MQGIRIPTARGTPVPLFVVAEVEFATGPGTIERYDQKTRTELEADLAPGAVLGPALERIHALPTAHAMPEGASIQQAGDAEVMGEVFGSFALAMETGILLVYVVLVLLFSSFPTPVTILMSLPLSVGGAIGALFLANYAISLSMVIGFLMLMGIVTKNAIMLVEFALQAMERGMTASEAVIDAGHKRARHIVMTTIAMTAGMVPSALETLRAGVRGLPSALARLARSRRGARRAGVVGSDARAEPRHLRPEPLDCSSGANALARDLCVRLPLASPKRRPAGNKRCTATLEPITQRCCGIC